MINIFKLPKLHLFRSYVRPGRFGGGFLTTFKIWKYIPGNVPGKQFPEIGPPVSIMSTGNQRRVLVAVDFGLGFTEVNWFTL